MGIGDIILAISDFIDDFGRRRDSRDSYSSSFSAPSTPTSKKRRPKPKKDVLDFTTSKKKYTPSVKKEKPLQPLWQKPENYDRKACQLIVNSLKQIKLDLAESAVEKLRQQYPYKTERELARILIVKKSFVLAKVVLNKRDPGAFPDNNAKEIIEGMETVQIPRIIKLSAEMIYQIALIYGLPSRYANWEIEVLSVFYAAILGDVAVQNGIDLLKSGTSPEKRIASEIKALMVYVIGETACLFYEKISFQGFNPFKKANAFYKISRQAQNYLRPFNSDNKIKKMISKEIEQAFPIDYHKLCDLLEAKSWKEADRESFDIFLKLMSRKELKLCEGVLILTNVKQPFLVRLSKIDEDLEILNNVWMENSDGRFGFAVQSQLYMETQNLEDFYQSVGWKTDTELKSYNQLNFDSDSPKGHLPGFWLRPDFPLLPDDTIADCIQVFLKYVSSLPVKRLEMDDAEFTIVNSSEQSTDVDSNEQQIDIENNN